MYTYTNPLFIYDNKKRKPSDSQNGQIFLVSYPRFWMIDCFWLLLPQSPHFSMSDPKTCAEGPSLFLKFDYSGFWHFCIFRIYMVTVLLWVVCECVFCARFYYFETWKRFFLVLAFKFPIFFFFWTTFEVEASHGICFKNDQILQIHVRRQRRKCWRQHWVQRWLGTSEQTRGKYGLTVNFFWTRNC